jgi:hypothetical protein
VARIDQKSYNKAIDEFVAALKTKYGCSGHIDEIEYETIYEVAEELKMNGMEKISGDFNRGYTKAIQDVQQIFNYIENDLIAHKKRLNSKLSKELLVCVLINREKVRENRNGFIRWNYLKKEFEWFE